MPNHLFVIRPDLYRDEYPIDRMSEKQITAENVDTKRLLLLAIGAIKSNETNINPTGNATASNTRSKGVN